MILLTTVQSRHITSSLFCKSAALLWRISISFSSAAAAPPEEAAAVAEGSGAVSTHIVDADGAE